MVIFYIFTKYKMSGYGTKKPGADRVQQLTFPAVFSEAYANSGLQSRYMPSQHLVPERLPMGTDLQSVYHQQKKDDAHRRVMNAVRDNARADYRFLHSHANYYNLPRVMLSQRQFANPSNGNQADIYSNRRVDGLRGGVLRTAEGQRWGRRKLGERVEELNAIDQAEAGFQLGETMAQTAEPMMVSQEVSDKATIDLVGRLQTIFNALESRKFDRLLMSDVSDFLKLLFRFSASASREELEDVLEYLNMIEEMLIEFDLEDIAEAQYVGADDDDDERDGSTDPRSVANKLNIVSTSLRKAREYVARMLAQVNRPVPERKKLSSALVKTLGFTQLNKVWDSPEKTATLQKTIRRTTDRFNAREAGFEPPSFGETGVFDKEDDNVFPSPLQSRYIIGSERPMERTRLSQSGIQDRTRRLLGEFVQRQRQARFDAQPRNEFGDRAGAFFGEELREDGVAPALRMPMRLPVDNAMPVPEEEEEEEEDEGLGVGAPAVAPAVARPVLRPAWLPDAFKQAKTLPQLQALAQRLRNEGYPIRVGDTSEVRNVKANFRRKFAL